MIVRGNVLSLLLSSFCIMLKGISPIMREWKMFITPVDPDECGPCKVEGLISYSVPGLVWPLIYEYRTEWFLPVRGE